MSGLLKRRRRERAAEKARLLEEAKESAAQQERDWVVQQLIAQKAEKAVQNAASKVRREAEAAATANIKEQE